VLGCGGGGGGNNGGGGGGGGNTEICGSVLGSVVPTLCGSVIDHDSLAPVTGATVKLLTATGGQVMVGGLPVIKVTTASGTYIFNSVPADAALIQVDPPTGYFTTEAGFNGHVYIYTLPSLATGAPPCVPSILPLPAGDRQLP